MKKDNLKEFWELIKPLKRTEYVEIRLSDANKPQFYYDMVDNYMKEAPHVFVKNKTQFFIKKFEDLVFLLEFSNGYFVDNFKICYGLNLRKKDKDGNLGGGYVNISNTRFVFLDIDKTDKTNLTEKDTEDLVTFIRIKIIPILEKYGLRQPTLISSGGGVHVIFKIIPQDITEGRKRWFRSFILHLISILKQYENSFCFSLDALHDQTRIAGLPETKNVKRGTDVTAIVVSDWNNNFKIRTERVKKHKGTKIDKKLLPKIDESLEWIVLKNDAPEGQRHQVLIFALKLLFKELDSIDVDEYEVQIDSLYGGTCNLDPFYGTDNKNYHPGIIINWCKRNMDWVQKNPEVYNKYLECIGGKNETRK